MLKQWLIYIPLGIPQIQSAGSRIANPLLRVALKVQNFIDHDEIKWGNPRTVPDGTVQPLF